MSRWAASLQAGGGRLRGRFLLLRRTVGFGGGEEASSFPTEGRGGNPGGATANHLEKKSIVVRLQHVKRVKVSYLYGYRRED